MEQHQEKTRTSFVPVYLVLALLGIGGYYFSQHPYRSVRPDQPPPVERPIVSSEVLEARLWQDPLRPVLEASSPDGCGEPAAPGPLLVLEDLDLEVERRVVARGRIEEPRPALTADLHAHRLEQLALEVRVALDHPGGRLEQEPRLPGSLVLLPVMIPGGPLADDAEQRRRMRYAVLSGLGASRFAPREAERIGYVETCWDARGFLAESGQALRIPYEWFRRRGGHQPRSLDAADSAEDVLVLWLDESAFPDRPLGRIDQLLRHLVGFCYGDEVRGETVPSEGSRRACPAPEGAYRLIGPASSSTLRTMLREEELRPSEWWDKRPETAAPAALDCLSTANPLDAEADLAGGAGESGSSAPEMLLNFAEFYLDRPAALYSGERTREGLRQQLEKAVDEATPALDDLPQPPSIDQVLVAVAPVSDALSGLRIEDSDRQWHSTVAGSWGLWYLEEEGPETDELTANGDATAEAGEVPGAPNPPSGSLSGERRSLPGLLAKGWEDARARSWVGASYWVAWQRRAERLLRGQCSEPGAAAADLLGTVEPVDRILPHLVVYPARSTASATALLEGLGDTDHPDRAVAKRFEEVVAAFVPVVARDDRLAETVLAELANRHLDLCTSNADQSLVLVGEWDTFYGRALVETFRDGLDECGGDRARLIERSYLRGLDGSLPSPASEYREEEPVFEAAAGLGPRRTVERATGPQQHDYLRRLTADLTAVDRRLRRGGEEGIRAIGVVGSDVHDKLLVLQALRRQFPRTLFFTTDLDAALLHPSDHDWNRNLLVASSYGLTLGEDLQADVPPFRDSYQTATFLATRLALATAPPGGSREAATELVPASWRGGQATPGDALAIRLPRLRQPSFERTLAALARGAGPPPRLFELGRTRPHDLTVPEAEGSPPRDIHPSRPQTLPAAGTILYLSLLSLVGGLLLVPVVPAVRRYTLGRTRSEVRPEVLGVDLGLFGAAIVLAALLAIAVADLLDPAGEPLAWIDGVSAWPTFLLRTLGAVAAVALIGVARKSLRRSDRRLVAEYDLPEAADDRSMWSEWLGRRREIPARRPEDGWRGVRDRLRSEAAAWWRARCGVSLSDWALADEHEAARPRWQRQPKAMEELWSRYRRCGRFGHRLCRIVPLTVLYGLFGCGLIFTTTDLHLPLRGSFAFILHGILLIVGIGALLLLTFFVVDAIRLCRRFVHGLASAPTCWPEAALERVRSERGLRPEEARWYLDAEIIADRTEVVGRLILYPFLVLFVLLVARSGLFDNWDWPWSLLVAFGLIAAFAVWSGLALRREAERARQEIVGALREQEVEAAASALTAGRRRQIRMLIEDVERLDRGAFAKLSHHPVVKAILLPFGGLGAAFLLELLAGLGL